MVQDRTHDVSCVDYHIKDLKKFGDEVEKAVNSAFPSSTSRYREVHVLMLSWELDTLGVIKEIIELRDLFKDVYQYDVEEWVIPNEHAHNALRKRINRFLDEFDEREGNLLIVYYGGHGYMNEERECVWSPNGEPHSNNNVYWSNLQGTLGLAESDTLILLDCCAAASSVSSSGSGVTEMIAACGFETWAPGVGRFSFTRGLIDELTRWSHNVTLSVATLHSKILTYVKGRRRFEPSTLYEERKTPIYVQISNASDRKSITLCPLKHIASSLHELAGSMVQEEHSSISSAMSGEGQSSSNLGSSQTSQSSLGQMWPDEDFQHPRVLLSLQLEEDQRLLTDEWIEWVKSIPAIVKYTRIQGIYKSTSTLLLLTMPVALWNLLPKDPAATFVAFIQSANLMKDKSLSTMANKNPTTFSVAKTIHESPARGLENDLSSLPLQEEGPDKRTRLLRLQSYNTTLLIDNFSFISAADLTTMQRIVTSIVLTVAKYNGDGATVSFSDAPPGKGEYVGLRTIEDVAHVFHNIDQGFGNGADQLARLILNKHLLDQEYRRNDLIRNLNLIVVYTAGEFSRGRDMGHMLRRFSEKFAKLKDPAYVVRVQCVQIGNSGFSQNFLRELGQVYGRLNTSHLRFTVDVVPWVEKEQDFLAEKILLSGIADRVDDEVEEGFQQADEWRKYSRNIL